MLYVDQVLFSMWIVAYIFKSINDQFSLMYNTDDNFEEKLFIIKNEILENMGHIQLQYDIMQKALDTCQVPTIETKYDDCIVAADLTIKETVKLIELYAKLVSLLGEFRKLVHSRKVKNKY